ncbi:MAG: alpha,2-mannosyltransferase [Frankiaceae bacterium]|nr:alpha,2-mannosyltransferase [Frankiaceae bacterium]
MTPMSRWRSLSHVAASTLASWVARPVRARVLAAVIVAASTALMLWPRLGQDEVHWLVDLQVYQGAGVAVRSGHSLYTYATPFPQRLPFTYPPFGGLLAIPLSLLSRYPLGIVWTAVEWALCLFLARKLFRPLIDRAGPLGPLVFAGAVVLTEWIVPIRDTFYFGQVNLFLVALVVVDLTVVRGRWPRGLLIGIAAAIKLTPALFIPYLWMTGRRRMAGVAAATFAGGQLLAAAILPSDSREYWTHTVFEGSRLGLNTVVSNQSIRGMLLRFALPSPYGSLIWLVLAAPVAVIGLRRAKQAYADGEVVLSIGLTGLTAALVSPVSWIHHFLWILLVIAALAAHAHDPRSVRRAIGIATVFVLNIPQWGEILVRGSGSYVLGRLLQETYLVLTVAVVTALPWPGQILAPVDALPSPSTGKEAHADDGEAASRPVVTP